MRIALLPSDESGTIAWEEQFGEREGRFLLAVDRSVVYRHPWDEREWFAGASEVQFRAAAEAWNAYTQAATATSDREGEAAVNRLREQLNRIGAISARPDSFWGVLIEQAEAGTL
jgi:hypothetical protein